MGAFLDKPKTEKLTASGEGNGLRYGVSAMQGWRMEMEDAHVCELSLPFEKNSCFFGVFDGHAGSKVAQYCSVNLLKTIVTTYSEGGEERSIKKAIREGFISLDATMREEPLWKENKDRSGSTAVVAVVTPEKIIFGNCGDSRGLLCRSDKVNFGTADHKPSNPEEKARIEKAGGTVMLQRVNGALAVSRALGDFDYKRVSSIPPTEQLVSPEPDVTVLDRDLVNDEFLLLACDGIYDVMTNEEVATYIRHQLTLRSDLTEICSLLIDKCLNKNSRDNMSIILVVFSGAPTVSAEAIKKEEEEQKKYLKILDDALKTLAEEAKDPMDLEENTVISYLHQMEELAKFEVYTRRNEIVDFLEEKRKEKFKEEDFNNTTGFSYVPDASAEFGLSLEEKVSVLPPPLEAGGEPLVTPEADSDTTTSMEDSKSTTNKTIM